MNALNSDSFVLEFSNLLNRRYEYSVDMLLSLSLYAPVPVSYAQQTKASLIRFIEMYIIWLGMRGYTSI